jgi:hypothetical protein
MASPSSIRPTAEPTELRARLSLDQLAALPPGSSELTEPLPDWVTEAHLRWLETGEGDPWGGYFG